jgi:hypothetical protein
MSAATQTAPQTRGERAAIAAIRDRIKTQYRQVPVADIEDLISRRHRAFDDSRIRDFIPVLVERQVKSALAGR